MEKKNIGSTQAENGLTQNEALSGLDTCITAASAEHARAHNDDEPCDDGRMGETE